VAEHEAKAAKRARALVPARREEPVPDGTKTKKFGTRCGLALCQSLGGDEFKRAQPRGVVVNVRDDDQLVSAGLRDKRVHARTNRAW
jgi:hypothetical protein